MGIFTTKPSSAKAFDAIAPYLSKALQSDPTILALVQQYNASQDHQQKMQIAGQMDERARALNGGKPLKGFLIDPTTGGLKREGDPFFETALPLMTAVGGGIGAMNQAAASAAARAGGGLGYGTTYATPGATAPLPLGTTPPVLPFGTTYATPLAATGLTAADRIRKVATKAPTSAPAPDKPSDTKSDPTDDKSGSDLPSIIKKIVMGIAPVVAGVTARKFSGGFDGPGGDGGVKMPPELTQMLAVAMRRMSEQEPMFQAVNKQALAGLPTYTKEGT